MFLILFSVVEKCIFYHCKFLSEKNFTKFICLKHKSGVVKVSVDNLKKIWKDHMEKLMNFENEWSDSIGAIKVEGPVRRTEVEEVHIEWY